MAGGCHAWSIYPRRHLVTLKLLAENHESLEKSTDWYLFKLAFNIKGERKSSNNTRPDAERHV